MQYDKNGVIQAQRRSLIENAVLVILLIILLEPDGFTNYLGEFWSSVWEYLVLADCVLLLAVQILIIRRVNQVFWLIGLYYCPIFIATILNHSSLLPAVYYPCRILSFIILIDYCARRRKLLGLFVTMKIVLSVYIIVTVFFQFVAQDYFGYTAAYNYWNFITSDNALGYWYIPFILIVYVSNQNKSKWKQRQELIIWGMVCLISLLRAWAAACLVFFIVFLLMIFWHRLSVMKILTPLTGFFINVGISAVMIFFQLKNFFAQGIFFWFINDVLGKMRSLNIRGYIWAETIQSVLKKPILGYGTSKGGRMDIIYVAELNNTWFSHNMFLEVLIQGGIVAFVFLGLIYFYAGKKINRSKKDSEFSRMIGISLFCLMLMQVSEFSLYLPLTNLPLILCFYYKDVINERQRGERQNG